MSDVIRAAKIYLAIKSEGRKEAARREKLLILRQLTHKIGEIPEAKRQQIDRLSLDQLEALGETLLDFSSVNSLIEWLDLNATAAQPMD
jgi:hypothetical protein